MTAVLIPYRGPSAIGPRLEQQAKSALVPTLTKSVIGSSASRCQTSDGASIIVHAKKDDGGQPTGNAGGRIGCGVIGS